jgi:hypothetical protein
MSVETDPLELLITTAAAVYGPIATAAIAHSKPASLREQSIQACVDDSLAVAAKIIEGAKARRELARQLATRALEEERARSALTSLRNGEREVT